MELEAEPPGLETELDIRQCTGIIRKIGAAPLMRYQGLIWMMFLLLSSGKVR